MKKLLLYAVATAIIQYASTQSHEFKKDTFLVGHVVDSTIKKNNLYTEISFGPTGRNLVSNYDPLNGRDFQATLETHFKVGFFPVNRLLVGWGFTPYITFSNLGVEGFRWSTGPFVRYYLPFYRIKRNKQISSPVSLYFFCNTYFGQFNPVVLDRPFDSRFTFGVAAGIGLHFQVNKNLSINLELGPRLNVMSEEFGGVQVTTLLNLGINFGFDTRKDKQLKKLSKMKPDK